MVVLNLQARMHPGKVGEREWDVISKGERGGAHAMK